jgi:hypothetical protein
VQPYELLVNNDDMPQRADVIAIKLAGEKSLETEIETSQLPLAERAAPVNYCPTGATIFVRWFTDLTAAEPWINWSTARFKDDGKTRTYLFPIGDRISWKAAAHINKLLLMGVPKNYRVVDARLISEEALVPSLSPKVEKSSVGGNLNPDHLNSDHLNSDQKTVNEDSLRDGFYPVNSAENVRLDWDAGMIAGASSCKLQISEPDVSFSHLAGGFRESTDGEQASKIVDNLPLSGARNLTRQDFGIQGKYEVRLAAVDANGALLGFYSDPVSLMVSDRPFATELDKAMFNLRAQKNEYQNKRGFESKLERPI